MNADSSQKKNTSRDMASPEVAGLLASIGGFATGAGLMIDDAKDFGLLGVERDPPVPHHYIYGLIIMLASLIGTCAFGIKLLEKIANKKHK